MMTLKIFFYADMQLEFPRISTYKYIACKHYVDKVVLFKYTSCQQKF